MLPHLSKGDFVWLDPTLIRSNFQQHTQSLSSLTDSPLPLAARVLAISTNTAKSSQQCQQDNYDCEHILLLDDEGNKHEFNSLEMQRWAIRPMHPTSIQSVPDLVQLVELEEAALLRCLHIRYRQSIFYTFIGSRILLAFNPQPVSPKDEPFFHVQPQNQANTLTNQELLPPHIYSFGASILDSLQNVVEKAHGNNQNCCVVFSGESGSGKSQSANQLLTFLAAQTGMSSIQTRLHAANLLIEAFCNARTAVNWNSSKHGRHLQLQYCVDSNAKPILSSVHIQLFLLEARRVVEAQTNFTNRGNFHIFYLLLAGINPQQRLELDLTNDRVCSYRLLASKNDDYWKTSNDEFDENNLATAYSQQFNLSAILAAMRVLMFREAEICAILRTLAIILHMGNLRYNVRTVDGSAARVEIVDKINLQRICRLLKIDESVLLTNLITKAAKTTIVAEDNFVESVTIEEAINLRDDLITEIYARLVELILKRINEALVAQKNNQKVGQRDRKIEIVHILDFQSQENNIKFGNGFEQLYVNYAAECMQQFFIRRTFKLKQAEYVSEGFTDLELNRLPYADNMSILEMLAVQPWSIMSVLDNITSQTGATEEFFLTKLNAAQMENEQQQQCLYQKPKSELLKQFVVCHYTGPVQYTIKGMLTKNRRNDGATKVLNRLVDSSEFKFLRRLFSETTLTPENGLYAMKKCSDQQNNMYSNGDLEQHKIEDTKCTHIRRSMNLLMSNLERCENIYFVRCLKANDSQRNDYFDSSSILRQIRKFDLLATVRICQASFPICMENAQFVQRYRAIIRGTSLPQACHYAHSTRYICHTIFGENVSPDFVLFGKNKVFLKADKHSQLEMLRNRRYKACALLVQKYIQGWAQRQRYERLRWAAIVFQKNWRALIERKRFKKFLHGIIQLQALVRAHQHVHRYRWLHANIVYIQAICRAALLRHELRCLPTRAQRYDAMRNRFEWQTILNGGGKPPALNLHAKELDEDTTNQNLQISFGSIHLVEDEKTCIKNNNYDKYNVDDAFQWDKFALIYFQAQHSIYHTRAMLRHSLLRQKKPLDELLALTVWRRLLQLIGDMDVFSATQGDEQSPASKMALSSRSHESSIISRLKSFYGRDYSRMELEQLKAAIITRDPNDFNALKNQSRSTMWKYLSASLNRGINFLVDREQEESAFAKIQFIVAVGILIPQLRDEIFCQICKQLNKNPIIISARRAWNLLIICANTFPSSERLLPYLLNFICANSLTTLNLRKLQQAIQRSHQTGPRRQPTILAEFAAAYTGTSMQIDVHLPDERVFPVLIHSQTTVAEICTHLANKMRMKNSFGFGLFLSFGQNVRALGAGMKRIIDSISHAEQHTKNNTNIIPSWQLHFRKEIFEPFKNDIFEDIIALDLIYQQIVRGIHFGEYQCEQDEDYALLAAYQFYVANAKSDRINESIDVFALEEQLSMYLPKSKFQSAKFDDERDNGVDSRQKWVHLVMHAYRKKIHKKEEMPSPNAAQVKCQLLEFAQTKWPLHFSKFFDVYKFSGPPLPSNKLTLAINSNGICILDECENVEVFNDESHRILLRISFIELTTVSYGRSKQQSAEAISLHLMNGDHYTFQSELAHEMFQLLGYILDGLFERSRYAIALDNNTTICDDDAMHEQTPTNFLTLEKGDLLILDIPFGKQREQAQFLSHQTLSVENTRTGMRGNVLLQTIKILACIEKPCLDQLAAILAQTSMSDASNNGDKTTTNAVSYYDIYSSVQGKQFYEFPAFCPPAIGGGTFGMHFPTIFQSFPFIQSAYTLEHFAADNFREQVHSSGTKSIELLWRHSYKPLHMPLLKRIVINGNKEVIEESIISYTYILKYMGDQPSQPPQYFLEHTDLIFAAPLKFEILRDETYCQLMKQLTDNPNPISEERGWELMWLCLGLFPPSKGLRMEIARFTETRYLPIAVDCAMRLKKIICQCPDLSLCRRFPPHQVELEAIRHRQTQIYHKFHLPNGTQNTVELESWSTARDFAARIASRICLASPVGFSLFIKLGEKVVCIPELEFFFDFIHQLQDWARKNARRQNGGLLNAPGWTFNYQVHFMRKLWLDVELGADLLQDLIFHYHQELPKYLRGYHRIDKREVVHYAALILRAQTLDGKHPPLQHLQHILRQLVPRDLLKVYGQNEWKKLITAEFDQPGMPKCSADAKMAFLRQISREPTFGSAFFEVKQSADPTLCANLLVAINREGMSLYEHEGKRYICTYGFEQIAKWQAANTYFHITFVKGRRLLFETTLGHKLDDLITTYIQALIARQGKAADVRNCNNKKLEKFQSTVQKQLYSSSIYGDRYCRENA